MIKPEGGEGLPHAPASFRKLTLATGASATPSPRGDAPKTPQSSPRVCEANSTVSESERTTHPGVLFSVRQSDLPELPALARKFYDLGFTLYATTGNAATIERSGMEVTHVAKVHEDYNNNVMTLLESGKVAYVISTSAKGRDPVAESVKLRRLAVERDIDCLTALDTANVLADCLASDYTLDNLSLVDINSDFMGGKYE
ncbi:MAG: hypothetical protein MSH65_07625 [Spirochaetia bacterium]|nr:hypothetical protein [Spirochaetia bacterium]